jgi:SurA N-terminal domain
MALLFLYVLVATGDAQAVAPAEVCPPPSTSSVTALPNPAPSASLLSPAPEQIVACVGAQSITGATFSHWADIARRSGGKHPPSTAEVTNQAMGFLISSDWVLDEAADLSIHMSEGEVRHTFDHIRTQQFPKRKEFKAFLRQSGETVADLLFRVRLNLLSTEIQRHVLAGHRTKNSRKRALGSFVDAFKIKWTAQTYCEPDYATPDCGHVQAAL